MARSVISINKSKRGVGKTTTVINLASALAQKAKRFWWWIWILRKRYNWLGTDLIMMSLSIYNVLIGKTSVQNQFNKVT